MPNPQNPFFYHATTRKLVALFGSIFDNIQVNFETNGIPYKVPIRLSTRDKFLTQLEDNPDLYATQSARQTVWMAFDLTGMNYASERATNNTLRIKHESVDEYFMYNRVPYDLSFQLYISAKQFETSLMVLEQILPLFKPALNITINELDEFNLQTDISINLDSVSNDSEIEGSLTEQRRIFWTLQFTVQAFYYPAVERENVIKKAQIAVQDMKDKNIDNWFNRYTSEVVPSTASKKEKHTIKDSVETNKA